MLTLESEVDVEGSSVEFVNGFIVAKLKKEEEKGWNSVGYDVSALPEEAMILNRGIVKSTYMKNKEIVEKIIEADVEEVKDSVQPVAEIEAKATTESETSPPPSQEPKLQLKQF